MSEADRLVGTVLSERYQIESLLGSGGMGTVYKAQHLMLHRPVAVKMLQIHLGDDAHERINRFIQEGRVISSFSHPNIITAYDFGVDQGKVFLVMEYVEGASFLDVLTENKRIPWRRAVEIFIQMCDALAYAHAREIIHRDIKPSNVMLTRDDRGRDLVKIVDFGVAKVLNAGPQSHAPKTRTGVVFGSPPYMSPEQCTGHAPDFRSDIYSLGCVMYEALTGRMPINGENSLEILHKQVISIPLEFHELSPAVDVPSGLEKIVFKALEKDVENRYQTMRELKADLTNLIDDAKFVPAVPEVPTVVAQRDHRRQYIAATAAILLAVSVSTITFPKSRAEHADLTIHSAPVAEVIPQPSSLPLVVAPTKCPTLKDEKALSAAVLTLARMLDSSGHGKEAEAQLKELVRREQKFLPADDPALQDIKRIEMSLEKKNRSKH